MREFTKKYYIQLIAIITLFVLAVVMFSQSFNVRNMTKEKSKESKQLQLDYALAHEFLRHSSEFKSNAEYIENSNGWMSMLLPDDDDEKVQLFSTLEQLAEDTGNNSITLSVVQPAAKTKQKKATKTDDEVVNDTMSMSVTIVGSYGDLIYFLEKIENLRYFADVASLNIIKTSEDKRRVDVDGEAEDLLRDDLLRTTMTIVFYLDK